MLSKAAKFGFPVIGSRTAATKQAVQLAKYLNIEVIGYLRGKMATIYTSAGRVENDVTEESAVENALNWGELSNNKAKKAIERN